VFLAAAFGVGLTLGRVTRNADIHAISEQMHRDDRSGGDSDTVQRPVTGAMTPSAASDPTAARNAGAPAATARPRGGELR
jgi:hypothetical protein